MTVDPLAGAVVGHLVGDYILQNDYIARYKKTNSWVCAGHCFWWALAVMIFSGQGYPHNELKAFIVFSILFITHFIQDRTNLVKVWMIKISHQELFAQPPMAPWSIIVVDNVWHIVAIWCVWRFIV